MVIVYKEAEAVTSPDCTAMGVGAGFRTQEPGTRACTHSKRLDPFSPGLLTFPHYLEMVEIRYV